MERETAKNTVVLKDDENVGAIQIADDVVAMIASLATTEVEGVNAMAGNDYQRADEQGWRKEPDKGCAGRSAGRKCNCGFGSYHGVRLQYPGYLPEGTGKGEVSH